jgi:hypothetical protein
LTLPKKARFDSQQALSWFLCDYLFLSKKATAPIKAKVAAAAMT